MIYQAGGVVKLITQSLRVSGHGNARDLQLMINLLQPKYLFPIQGEYRELDAHAKAAMAVGMLPERIFIPKRELVWLMRMVTLSQLEQFQQEMS